MSIKDIYGQEQKSRALYFPYQNKRMCLENHWASKAAYSYLFSKPTKYQTIIGNKDLKED